MEGLLPVGGPELWQVGAGLGWCLCTCGPARQSHQLLDPEGLLSHAVHLDDLDLKVTRAAQ